MTMHWMIRSLPLVIVVLALPFVDACGGAMQQERREEPRPDPRAEMDAQEARLHAAEQQLEEAGPACEQSCRAGGAICDAAHRICTIAGELGDASSAERCQRAQVSCMQANDRLESCHCDPERPDGGVACLGDALSYF